MAYLCSQNKNMKTPEQKEGQNFIVTTDNGQRIFRRLYKMGDACIFLCRQGEAIVEINSEEYRIVPHTHGVLIPGVIIENARMSDDFRASYIVFPDSLFHEVTARLDPSFYEFLKDTPMVTLPTDRIATIDRTLALIEELYHDHRHCFREQILFNHIQSFLLDIYDKTHRKFLERQSEGISRQEELFKQYVLLVHEHCTRQREVSFYADRLCISPRYLSTVAQNVTGTTAKSIIDRHVILEIKAMLKSTTLSIQEIAHRLHFPDQSFFARYFKKHTGMSPVQYRG